MQAIKTGEQATPLQTLYETVHTSQCHQLILLCLDSFLGHLEKRLVFGVGITELCHLASHPTVAAASLWLLLLLSCRLRLVRRWCTLCIAISCHCAVSSSYGIVSSSSSSSLLLLFGGQGGKGSATTTTPNARVGSTSFGCFTGLVVRLESDEPPRPSRKARGFWNVSFQSDVDC